MCESSYSSTGHFFFLWGGVHQISVISFKLLCFRTFTSAGFVLSQLPLARPSVLLLDDTTLAFVINKGSAFTGRTVATEESSLAVRDTISSGSCLVAVAADEAASEESNGS